MDTGEFLDHALNWLSGRQGVVAVALVGSCARETANTGSDIDLVILATQPSAYFEDLSWANELGQTTGTAVEDWGRVVSLRVYYSGGPEVDYGFSTPDWADLPLDDGTRTVVLGGMKVLYDPFGLLARLQAAVHEFNG